VRSLVIQWYNDDTDRRILSGFSFEGSKVWLSAENQLNYKAAFDLAVQTNGASLPVTIKLGNDDKPVYRVFSQLEDFRTFYTAALSYIQQTIADGWKLKDAFKMEDYAV
jgi:hypothetical protein